MAVRVAAKVCPYSLAVFALTLNFDTENMSIFDQPPYTVFAARQLNCAKVYCLKHIGCVALIFDDVDLCGHLSISLCLLVTNNYLTILSLCYKGYRQIILKKLGNQANGRDKKPNVKAAQ